MVKCVGIDFDIGREHRISVDAVNHRAPAGIVKRVARDQDRVARSAYAGEELDPLVAAVEGRVFDVPNGRSAASRRAHVIAEHHGGRATDGVDDLAGSCRCPHEIKGAAIDQTGVPARDSRRTRNDAPALPVGGGLIEFLVSASDGLSGDRRHADVDHSCIMVDVVIARDRNGPQTGLRDCERVAAGRD